jgi:hypothetical protein
MVMKTASSEAFRPTYEATGCHNQEEHTMAVAGLLSRTAGFDFLLALLKCVVVNLAMFLLS